MEYSNDFLTTENNTPALWMAQFPKLNVGDNKYVRGHAMIFGGYPLTGAARLAARAAARIGAGLVTVAVPAKAFTICAQSLLSIMVKSINSSKEFTQLLQDPRITAYLIGPGAGIKNSLRTRIIMLLKTGKPVVLDADALSVFATHPDKLFENIKGPCVLTPHEGEFSRLFDIQGDKLQRAQEAAKRSHAVVILKGNHTIIAAPDGRAVVNTQAPATLATAGTGDVLSGIVTGLLAQGMEPFAAACAAVWIHAEAANIFGVGLMAEDLPDILPKVLQKLNKLEV